MSTEEKNENILIGYESLRAVAGGNGEKGPHSGGDGSQTNNDTDRNVHEKSSTIIKWLSEQLCPGTAMTAKHIIVVKNGGSAIGCKTCNLYYPIS
jgi:hypothetical protein